MPQRISADALELLGWFAVGAGMVVLMFLLSVLVGDGFYIGWVLVE